MPLDSPVQAWLSSRRYEMKILAIASRPSAKRASNNAVQSKAALWTTQAERSDVQALAGNPGNVPSIAGAIISMRESTASSNRMGMFNRCGIESMGLYHELRPELAPVRDALRILLDDLVTGAVQLR